MARVPAGGSIDAPGAMAEDGAMAQAPSASADTAADMANATARGTGFDIGFPLGSDSSGQAPQARSKFADANAQFR
jgi:hypothetical protein